MKNIKQILSVCLLSGTVHLATTSCVFNNKEKFEKSKPNIILLLVDDMGFGDISAHGNPLLKTPNFDRLQNESLSFTDFLVSPTCAPTRCALMTGRHEFKSGVTHTVEPRNNMDLNARILPQILKTAGYKTAMFGKWHLGWGEGYRPYERGFDLALNIMGDNQNSHFDPTMIRNGVEEKHIGYRTDIFFDEAMKYIESSKDDPDPFFCYLATFTPHGPLKVPEEYSKPFEGKSEYPNFHGMVANVDKNMGLLLNKLDELGIAENTLLIVINDNGATFGVDTWNAGMRGVKVTAWYGAIHAYSFWRWPGTLQPGTRDQLTCHHDVLPTLSKIAGAELDSDFSEKLDGFDLTPLFEEDNPDWKGKDRMIVHHSGRWKTGTAQKHEYAFCGIRFGKYHLLRNYPCMDPDCSKTEPHAICRLHREYLLDPSKPGYYGARVNYKFTEPGEWALFDFEKDLHENHNIADEKPELVKRMSVYYDDWWNSLPLSSNPLP